ncbi:MAG TPA: L,D-transpeptidase family protein [Candidatus Desulfobacillus sp.]|nr:L,D-transpeptidase family protein [Candidatus Desulfobacillus sp.]
MLATVLRPMRRRRMTPAFVSALLALVLFAGVAGADEATLRGAMQALPEGQGHSWLISELERFYAGADFRPAWLEGGRPRRQALQALDILRRAGEDGLDAGDYAAEALAERFAVAAARPLAEQDAARLDVALSAALLRWLRDVGAGRVNPRALGVLIESPPESSGFAGRLRRALDGDDLAGLAAAAPPSYPSYQRLRQALAEYRRLAAELPAPSLPPLRKLEPGMPYAGLAELQRLLVALGDLPEAAPLPARYEGELVEAVRRFQARHGLDADGILGAQSFAQLNMPLAHRVRQIELALERLRWLPPLRAEKLVAINIPEFRLRGLEVREGRALRRLAMNVVVGRAAVTQTPVFMGALRQIEYNPWWNVPASITRNEIVAKLRRDPGYLAREGMEIVGGAVDRDADGRIDEAGLVALRRGELRLRQRPGPRNALGRIKFVLPNDMDIYLHDTPSRALFARSRRDFSHGCIRVEDPAALAMFLLEGQAEGGEARVRAALESGISSAVRLAKPVPVIVFYATAVAEEDGRVLFLPDIYRHDEALARALRARPRPAYQ